jgi:polar amino acid transport system substrate-binding protein
VRRRNLGWIALVLAGALALSACGSDSKKASDYVTPGILTVATSLPAPGFWNGDGPDKITGGYEYGLAQAISSKLGFGGKVKVVNVSFDQLVAGDLHNFDIALSQVTITADRAKVVDFSQPYYTSDQGVLMPESKTISTLAEAKKLKWGVQTATTALDLLNKIKPDTKVRSYEQTTSLFAALHAGDIDAVMLDTAIVLEEAHQANSGFHVVAQFDSGEKYGAIYQKNSALKAKIDPIIQGFTSDGTLTKLIAKWLKPELGTDPTKVPVISP